MLNKIIFMVLTTLIVSPTLRGQEDVSITLSEVILSDAKLKQHATGSKIQSISDSVFVVPASTLTELLSSQSTIYFKENGYGAVSSASLRGTSASQTAVVWNGININSQLTGQTDFNTISGHGYDEIKIRYGGGSTQYASGAIGGSIHLTDVHTFNSPWSTELGIGYGAFDTYRMNYTMSHGSEKLAFDLGGRYIDSKNDYAFLGTDQKNENGAFKHTNLNASASYILSKKQVVKFYQNFFTGDRQFPYSLTAQSDDKYQDTNSRSLIEWSHYKGQTIHSLALAYIYENFQYYPNRGRPEFQSGHSNNVIAKYNLNRSFGSIRLNSLLEYNRISAAGNSISTAHRHLYVGSILLSHRISNKLSYGLNLRQELLSDYSSPLVYAADGKLKVNNKYTIKASVSKNYRVPTFNDLYWSGPGAEGNTSLSPETSLQLEMTHSYDFANFNSKASIYYISTSRMIQWSPDNRGIWSPNNVDNTRQYGLEVDMSYVKLLRKHQISLNQQYSYVRSSNMDTAYDLIYVPRHKFTSNMSYQYQSWGMQLQSIYTGSVYTTTDNSSALAGYHVSNMEINKKFHTAADFKVTVAVSIKNIFNKNYQNVAFRPMPNRHLHIQLQTKF